MTRPAPRRLLACLLAALAGTTGTTALTSALTSSSAAAATSETTRTPLRVSLETLAPATIPQRGVVTLTGRVTNRSQETWTDLNAYLLTSDTPLRSRAELAEAALSEPDAPVGNRRAAEGLYDEVGDLAPGESVGYRLSVRRKDLGISGEQGVYWVGVHVLGAVDGARDTLADGRARTFMPLMPAPGSAAAGRARTRLSLVVPLRAPVRRGAAGRLLDAARWNHSLATDGRLDRLLRLSADARRPVTWVLDPAVLDAVGSLALGNPPVDPPRGEPGGPSGTPSAQASDDGSAAADDASPPADEADPGDGAGEQETGPGTRTPEARKARAWLDELQRQAPGRTVASVPYGDLDVAAVLRSPLSSMYTRAVELSGRTLADHGIETVQPVVDPPSGSLPAAALPVIGPETPVLLDHQVLPDATGPVVRQDGGPPVVLTDTAAGAGGPQPNSQYAALSFRQRLVSDAALHAISSQRGEPLVVTTPDDWNPGDAWAGSDFFGGLDQPWLAHVDLPSVVATAPSGTGADPDTAVYPQADREAQVPLANLLMSRRLAQTGGIFARLLTTDDTIDDRLAKVALLGASATARRDPGRARALTSATDDYVRDQMAEVRVEGPPFVMMSGESGPIQVTLVNGLDQSVTVGLRVVTPSSSLKIGEVEPVTLGPGRRTSVRLTASSDDIGVHAVRLATTDANGVPLGPEASFSVRTSHVSTVIWVIMGAGGALLFLAIVVRLFRRVRRRRSTHGPLLRREEGV